MRRTFTIVIAAAALGGLAGGMIGLALADGSSSTGTAQASTGVRTAPVSSPVGGGLTAEQIYKSDAPGVVVITATQTEQVPPTLFTPPTQEQVRSLGSGFVIDSKGDVVTNDHVVQGATGIRVGFTSGATYPAKIVGTDPSTDVAVVRVKARSSALHPLAFGDSSALEVGDPVYAIGNPFGLDRTMTAGIVSSTARDIQAPNGFSIPDAIQTDAPINHGNSGGPLLDRAGHVVGINSQIEGGTVDANVGVGFAVPSNTAGSVADELIASGHAEHAWLGVKVEAIDPAVARVVRGLPSHGVVIARVVKGSPAAKAGLAAATRQVTVNGLSALTGGDSIVSVAGRPVYSPEQVADAAAVRKPGDHLTLKVVRGGATRTVVVTLGNVPSKT
jgi:S1-C subfamily serine protease